MPSRPPPPDPPRGKRSAQLPEGAKGGKRSAQLPEGAKDGKREPQALSDWVPRVLEEIGLGGASDAARLVRAWDEAAGPELARHCRPQGARKGVVYATVPDSAWMQRVQLEKPRILARLRAELGMEAARELRVRIAGRGDAR